MDRRKDLFDRYNAKCVRVRDFSSIINNSIVMDKEIYEEFVRNFDDALEELKKCSEDVKLFSSRLIIDENTYNGRICKLIDTLLKDIQNLFYNGDITKARTIECECNDVMDILAKDTLDKNDEKALRVFTEKYKEYYAVEEVETIEIEDEEEPPSPRNVKSCGITGSAFAQIYGENLSNERYRKLKNHLYKLFINKYIKEGTVDFNIGISYGFPLICVEVLSLIKQTKHPEININCAIPFRRFTDGWNVTAKNLFNDIMENCSVVYIDDMYRDCPSINDFILKRNDYIIGKSTDALSCMRDTEETFPYDFLNKAVDSCKTVYNIDVRTLTLKCLKK